MPRFHVMTDYNPIVEDEVLLPLGELNEENTVIFLTLTVPSNLIGTDLGALMPSFTWSPLTSKIVISTSCPITMDSLDFLDNASISLFFVSVMPKRGF